MRTYDSKRAQPKIMLFGAGSLTANVLHLLARSRSASLVVVGRDIEKTFRLVNLVRLTALQLGETVEIEAAATDLLDTGRTAELVAKHKPDLIFNGATLQSWRVLTTLPKDKFEALDAAQFGPWLPMHLTLMHRLMVAVIASGRRPAVVNAAFPDAVNPILSRRGLGPLIGIGNVANIIPALQSASAEMLGVPVEQTQVRLVAQHYFSHFVPRYGKPAEAPFRLSVQIEGHDVTGDIDETSLLDAVGTRFRRLGGVDGQILTAASAVRVIEGLTGQQDVRTHAPGPLGLPGGYPVRLGKMSVSLDLPEGLSVEQAVSINERCQAVDGIERIDLDGTAHFTDREMQIMRHLLRYECKSMPVEDSLDRATELAAKYREYARRPA